MTIRAIETSWNGRLFRSRLEARWAVFFDSLGLRYEYEPEGFDLGGYGWYLPDFWLPHISTWVEIKPAGETLADWPDHPVFKAQGDRWPFNSSADPNAPRVMPGRNPIDDPFVLLAGEPWVDPHNESDDSAYSYNGFIAGDSNYRWCECPVCGLIGIEFDGRAGRLNCDCQTSDKAYNTHSPRLLTAYAVATSARFERKRRG